MCALASTYVVLCFLYHAVASFPPAIEIPMAHVSLPSHFCLPLLFPVSVHFPLILCYFIPFCVSTLNHPHLFIFPCRTIHIPFYRRPPTPPHPPHSLSTHWKMYGRASRFAPCELSRTRTQHPLPLTLTETDSGAQSAQLIHHTPPNVSFVFIINTLQSFREGVGVCKYPKSMFTIDLAANSNTLIFFA